MKTRLGSAMIDQRRAVNRRQFLQGMTQFAAVAAAAPALGSSDAWRGVSCTTLTAGRPEDVSMSSDRLEDVFARIQRRVSDGLFPGATALVAGTAVFSGGGVESYARNIALLRGD